MLHLTSNFIILKFNSNNQDSFGNLRVKNIKNSKSIVKKMTQIKVRYKKYTNNKNYIYTTHNF